MSARGKGTAAYFDTDADDQYRLVPCLRGLTPAGYERGVVEGDPCLGDEGPELYSGDLKRTPIVGSMDFTPNEATIENALEAAIAADTTIKMAVKFNLSTPVYMFCTGKLTKLVPASIERDKKYSRDFEFIPTSAWSYSGTAPTLES